MTEPPATSGPRAHPIETETTAESLTVVRAWRVTARAVDSTSGPGADAVIVVGHALREARFEVVHALAVGAWRVHGFNPFADNAFANA